MAPMPREIPAERIRERAYELWERNHRPDGLEMQFWLVAERELRAALEEGDRSEPEAGRRSDCDERVPR